MVAGISEFPVDKARQCDPVFNVDATGAYFATYYGLRRAPLDGSNPNGVSLSAPKTGFEWLTPADIALDDSGIYLAAEGPAVSDAVTKLSRDGTPLGGVQNAGGGGRIALDAATLFIVSGGTRGSSLWSVPRTLSGEPTATLVDGTMLPQEWIWSSVAVTGERLFWVGGGKLHSAAKGGGDVKTLATDASGSTVSVDATHVYFVGVDRRLSRVPIDGSPGEQTLSDLVANGATIDASFAYFTTDNAVMRVPLAGGTAQVVAAFGYRSSPRVIVDATNVYWVSCEIGAGMTLRVQHKPM